MVLERVWKGHVARGRAVRGQYSFLKAKYEPRMVPASFDFPVANLNREAGTVGQLATLLGFKSPITPLRPFKTQLLPSRSLLSAAERKVADVERVRLCQSIWTLEHSLK